MATKSKKNTNNQPKEPKKICQNTDCDSMGKYQANSKFYKSRNVFIGYHPYCKECVNKMVDVNNIQTVYDILQTLDTPFIYDVWKEALASIDGKYIDRYLELINKKDREIGLFLLVNFCDFVFVVNHNNGWFVFVDFIRCKVCVSYNDNLISRLNLSCSCSI